MNKTNSVIIAAILLSFTAIANATSVDNSNGVSVIDNQSSSTEVQRFGLGFKSSYIKRINKFKILAQQVDNAEAEYEEQKDIVSIGLNFGFKSSYAKRFNKFKVSTQQVTNVENEYVEKENTVSNGFSFGFNSPTIKRFNKFKITGKQVTKVEPVNKAEEKTASRGFNLGSNY